jgi:uncharacterized protein (TIGR02646 family)
LIWIDLEHKRPTDTDIPGWMPWSKGKWEAWLAESNSLVAELIKLEGDGKRKERNEFIDAHGNHWGELKDWLLALSGGKCWFSETVNPSSHYEVEHFRPKKVAKALDGSERDGYWWLAFDYMNFRACANVPNRKKGGWFPLIAGSRCSTYGDRCEDYEHPYLIDPIVAGDVSLIAFDEEGKVVAVPGASNEDQERVRETVNRLKLNEHTPLAEERRKVWQKVDRRIEEYNAARARATAKDPVARVKMNLALSEIHCLTRPSQPLSAVARWCVHLRNDPKLSRLIA